ncbi:head-tail connector protein [Martelella mangrovi]|uniref:PhiE125 gp8 family phage protein n=1 Tax=Martelella mangrovi TaxID=1397477 RepID=A0ABV2IGH4_9HYPH
MSRMGWSEPVIIAPSNGEALSLETAKEQLTVDFDDDDSFIQRLIATACDHVEQVAGLVVTQKTIKLHCHSFGDLQRLPVGPVKEVVAVRYVGPDAIDGTLDPSTYEARLEGLRASIVIRPGKRWPAIQSGSRIAVDVVAGFDEVPAAVCQAMLLLIGTWYRNREQVITGTITAELPDSSGFWSLLSNYRLNA